MLYTEKKLLKRRHSGYDEHDDYESEMSEISEIEEVEEPARKRKKSETPLDSQVKDIDYDDDEGHVEDENVKHKKNNSRPKILLKKRELYVIQVMLN